MSNYQVIIQQRVDFPRRTLCADIVERLLDDPGVSKKGENVLSLYCTLCAYASVLLPDELYAKYDEPELQPGESIVNIGELSGRLRFWMRDIVYDQMDFLKSLGLIEYEVTDDGEDFRFRICEWERLNNINGAICRNNGEDDFFRVSDETRDMLRQFGDYSEMDMMLDLCLSIFNESKDLASLFGEPDEDEELSDPYMTLPDTVSLASLSERWGRSKLHILLALKKMERKGYIFTIPFERFYRDFSIYVGNPISLWLDICGTELDQGSRPIRMKFNMPGVKDLDCIISENTDVVGQWSVDIDALKEFALKHICKILDDNCDACIWCPQSKIRFYQHYGDTWPGELSFSMEIGCRPDKPSSVWEIYVCETRGREADEDEDFE